MKNLTKLFILTFLIFLTTQLFSQTIRVKGGLNLSKMHMVADGDIVSDDYDFLTGYNVGVTSEFPISKIFSLETGLILNSKGFSNNESYEGFEYKEKIDLLYLDIPVTAKASINVGDAKIYGTFGPYLGIALKGKMTAEASYEGETESSSQDISFGDGEEDDQIKRLDFGLTIGAGLEYKAISLGLSYGLGLANLSYDSDDDYDVMANNRVFAVTLGYKLFSN